MPQFALLYCFILQYLIYTLESFYFIWQQSIFSAWHLYSDILLFLFVHALDKCVH